MFAIHPPAADFLPTAPLANLKLRARLARRVREFFDGRGFLEVETPVLSADTVVDRHLDPLRVTLFDDPREPATGRTLWLQTSPEFGMKRLLAAGATAIYQIARVFRGGERGAWHNPEFTLVEWYRVGDGMREGIQLLAELAEHLLGMGTTERISYRQALLTYAEVDPLAASGLELAEVARRRGLASPPDFDVADRDAWLDLLLVECVQPHLGQTRPTIVYDYPASQAALAQVRDEDPPVAERFELFVRGVELANGYHELLDPDVLRARNAGSNQLRRADGKYPLPEDSRLLAAMQRGLPPSAGAALGFDRLVMLAAGTLDIAQVLAFPVERA
ncbi:MAG: EF-P lysine aminoacylase GenX [Candidatus Anammoximicrobium sp.]|nr:EF-P lysine aminoacylase GenX [Candidatus Anammoximicrobium sp.]